MNMTCKQVRLAVEEQREKISDLNSKCPETNEYSLQMSTRESEIVVNFEDGLPVQAIWKDGRKVVAVSLDIFILIKHSIVYGMRKDLINIDDSG
uniref:DUF4314 domain-containing protein n=1 Tax=Rhabditophanes sp. KR3021 TaxID=114890 RepID=A0AC35TNC2_9BILA